MLVRARVGYSGDHSPKVGAGTCPGKFYLFIVFYLATLSQYVTS
jgi:hypothetical protein